MIVCHCHALSDRDIRASVQGGATSAAAVGDACGAGTGCGGCMDLVEALVEDELAASGARRRSVPLPVLGTTGRVTR